MTDASSAAETKLVQSRKDRVIGLLFLAAFLLLSIFLESGEQIDLPNSTCDTVHTDPTPPFYSAVYPWLTAHQLHWFDRKADEFEVVAVYIPSDLEAVQQNLCLGRRHLADLINTLAPQSPSAIVIDKFFGQTTCNFNEEAIAQSKTLVDAVKGSHVPIVIGASADRAAMRADDSCLVTSPGQLDLVDEAHRGLTRLNANHEQIPLEWRILSQQPRTPYAHASPQQSLALAGATAALGQPGSNRPFSTIANSRRHPYAFLDLNFKQQSSSDLLCAQGSDDVRQRWHCPAPAASRALTGASSPAPATPFGNTLDHKVVVIGSRSESGVDHWMLLGHHVWGYELQAAYIQALLSHRYLRAVPGVWIVSLWIGFLLLLEGIPLLRRYLVSERDRHPFRWLESRIWIWIWSIAFFFTVAFVCIVSGFLPPLFMLSAVLFAMITRGVINGLQTSEHALLPHEKESPE